MEQKSPETDWECVENAIQTVAEREGVSVAQVRADMEEAILAAWNHPDPAVRAIWDSIPRAGKIPTPEELIAWGAQTLRTEHHDAP